MPDFINQQVSPWLSIKKHTYMHTGCVCKKSTLSYGAKAIIRRKTYKQQVPAKFTRHTKRLQPVLHAPAVEEHPRLHEDVAVYIPVTLGEEHLSDAQRRVETQQQ